MVIRSSNRTKMSMARLGRRASIAYALAVVAVTAACLAADGVRAQEGFLDRIFNGSERFGGGDRAAPVAAGERTAQMSGPDLLVRLDRLEAQIRQLTGLVEQLQYRNQQLEGQLRRMQEDSEYRFQELGAKGSTRPSASLRCGDPVRPCPAGRTP